MSEAGSGLADRGGGTAGRCLAAHGFRARRGDGLGTLELHNRCGERPAAVLIKVDGRVVFIGRGDGAGTVLGLGYTVTD